MGKITLTICLLAIALSIAEGLMPSEKFAREIKIIFGLILIIGIAKPVAGVFHGLSFPDTTSADIQIENIQKNTNSILENSIENNLCNEIKSMLSERGITSTEIYVNVNISEDFCISFNEVSLNCDNFSLAEGIIHETFGNETEVINLCNE